MRTRAILIVVAALLAGIVVGDGAAVEPAAATHSCGLDIQCGHPENAIGCLLNSVIGKDIFWCPY